MWLGLLLGIELARAVLAALTAQARSRDRRWKDAPTFDRTDADQLLAH